MTSATWPMQKTWRTMSSWSRTGTDNASHQGQYHHDVVEPYLGFTETSRNESQNNRYTCQSNASDRRRNHIRASIVTDVHHLIFELVGCDWRRHLERVLRVLSTSESYNSWYRRNKVSSENLRGDAIFIFVPHNLALDPLPAKRSDIWRAYGLAQISRLGYQG